MLELTSVSLIELPRENIIMESFFKKRQFLYSA